MKRVPIFLAAFLVETVSLCGAARALAQDPSQPQEQQEPQQSQPQQPKPAGRDYQPLGDTEESGQPAINNVTPDTTPLTGALIPGVGSQEMRHSYWVPGFQYGNFVRSSGGNQATGSGWNSTSFVAGNLSLLESWNRAQLAVNYSGGGSFSTDESQGNSSFHQLNLVQAFNGRRWQLSFIDEFSYLPQTQFGFGAASTLATPGISGGLAPAFPGLQTSYQPSQTIFTGIGSRYSNSITTQIAYQATSRGSVTLAGSYGILRFVEPGNIDTNDAIFSAGYDYALTRNDSIGFLYRFSEFRYLGDPQAIQDHVANIAYGRKITARLALQLFGGPEVTTFRVHTAGFSDRTSVSAGANLTYALARTNLSINYSHGVAGGSGVFTGASADTVQAGVNRRLSRVWSGNISFGYARNSSLASGSAVHSSLAFNSWYAGAGLDRPFGRTANVSVGYTAYLQDMNEDGCPAGACTSVLQHQISLSFQWHTRPLVLR